MNLFLEILSHMMNSNFYQTDGSTVGADKELHYVQQ